MQERRVSELVGKLSSERRKAADQISRTLTERVKPLGMPHLRFEIEISPRQQYDENGGDIIRFCFLPIKINRYNRYPRSLLVEKYRD